jgi:hypothetical protein
VRVLTSHVTHIGQLGFSADGGRLFAATGARAPGGGWLRGDNHGLDVWTLAGGPEPEDRRFVDTAVIGFAVNPGGRWLYVGTFEGYGSGAPPYLAVDLATWDTARLRLTTYHGFQLEAGPDERTVVGYGFDPAERPPGTGRLARWRQSPGRRPVEVWDQPMPSAGVWVAHLALDPARGRLITVELRGRLVAELVYDLTLRSLATGAVTGRVPIPGRTVDQLLFSPGGEWLVARAGRSLLAWDARDLSRKPVRVTNTGPRHFLAAAFHPSGRFLAATDNEATVKLYDTAGWSLSKTYSWNVGKLRSVAFSPDGTLAAAGSDTGRIVVWDVDL